MALHAIAPLRSPFLPVARSPPHARQPLSSAALCPTVLRDCPRCASAKQNRASPARQPDCFAPWPAVSAASALATSLPALAADTTGAAEAAAATGDGASLLLPGLAAAAGAGAVFGAVKAFVYFRLQYIIAATVGRSVPTGRAAPGGATVLDLNARNGRLLYYLPADVSKVLAVRPSVEPSLLKQQAVSAGVPVDIVPDGLLGLGRVASASVDAVISVDGFKGLTAADATSAAVAVARILKPNRPFIFVEPYRGNTAPPSESSHPDFPFLPDEALPLFDRVDFDYVLPAIDCHVVGVAIRSTDPVPAGPARGTETSTGFGAGKGRKKG